MLESKSGVGPFGAEAVIDGSPIPFAPKGIGEPSITASAPALNNAIRDAVGVRVTHIPATPERVFFAMQEKAKT